MKTDIFIPVRRNRGGVLLRICIVLATLGIVGFAIFQILHTLGQNQETDHRKALAISEYGLMTALQQVPSGATPPPAIPRTGYDDGWYRVTTSQRQRDDTLFCTVTSFGHFGSATERRQCVLQRVTTSSDSNWVRKRIH